jgi:hypothetical protein
MNFAAHGVAPFGYHLVNVALHVVVSLLVFALVARLATWLVAVAAALLFAVHPIHTEAVASVVGRAELLAASGFVLAWLAFLASDRLPSAARWTARRIALEAAGSACFFAALLAKENAIALPAVLALHDVLRPRSDGRPTALRAHWPRYAVLVAIALLFVALRARITGQLALAVPPLDNPLITLSAFERVLTTIAVIGMYAWRLIVAVAALDRLLRVGRFPRSRRRSPRRSCSGSPPSSASRWPRGSVARARRPSRSAS